MDGACNATRWKIEPQWFAWQTCCPPQGKKLVPHSCNVLLHLCSQHAGEAPAEGAVPPDEEIYAYMTANDIIPNEMTFTALARCASSRRDAAKAYLWVRRTPCRYFWGGLPCRFSPSTPTHAGEAKQGEGPDSEAALVRASAARLLPAGRNRAGAQAPAPPCSTALAPGCGARSAGARQAEEVLKELTEADLNLSEAEYEVLLQAYTCGRAPLALRPAVLALCSPSPLA